MPYPGEFELKFSLSEMKLVSDIHAAIVVMINKHNTACTAVEALISEVNANVEYDELEVTSFGDPLSRYIRGLSCASIGLTGVITDMRTLKGKPE
jgi:hypothetical protein